MMIIQPAFVTRGIIENALADVKRKKIPTAISKVLLESLSEGKCAQITHIGPFSEEGPTIEKVHQFIESRSKLTGKHREIYLSDIQKADPSKWKTIIRAANAMMVNSTLKQDGAKARRPLAPR